MNTEGNMEAICINTDNSGLKGIKVFGLTKGKKYQVKQSKEYDNYFDLENDFGIIESYRKERFEIMEEKKVQERFNVKCIDNYYNGNKLSLTVQKEYEVVAESSKSYSVKNDNGIIQPYDKKRFKKTKDILSVECICNLKMNPAYYSYLTLGKKYAVIEETKEEYLIENDKGEKETWYSKKLFKPVESQNINQTIDNLNKNIGSFTDKAIKSAEKEVGKQLKEKVMKALEVKKEGEQPINYEEEYKKLKEENESLYNENLKYLKEKEELAGGQKFLEGIIDKTNLENKELKAEKERFERDTRLKIEEINKSYEIIKKENEKLKEEAIKDHDRIKDRDIEIKQLKFNLEQTNNSGKSTNEYYYNWIETQEKNKIMESDLIKYEDTIKTLKVIIKNISEVL